jgi:hypothetical protein
MKKENKELVKFMKREFGDDISEEVKSIENEIDVLKLLEETEALSHPLSDFNARQKRDYIYKKYGMTEREKQLNRKRALEYYYKKKQGDDE